MSRNSPSRVPGFYRVAFYNLGMTSTHSRAESLLWEGLFYNWGELPRIVLYIYIYISFRAHLKIRNSHKTYPFSLISHCDMNVSWFSSVKYVCLDVDQSKTAWLRDHRFQLLNSDITTNDLVSSYVLSHWTCSGGKRHQYIRVPLPVKVARFKRLSAYIGKLISTYVIPGPKQHAIFY